MLAARTQTLCRCEGIDREGSGHKAVRFEMGDGVRRADRRREGKQVAVEFDQLLSRRRARRPTHTAMASKSSTST